MINPLLTAHPVALCWCEGALPLSPAHDVASQTPGAGLFTLLAAWLLVKVGDVQGSAQFRKYFRPLNKTHFQFRAT